MLQGIQVRIDESDRVVDLVRDSGGQLTDRRHLFGLQQLVLSFLEPMIGLLQARVVRLQRLLRPPDLAAVLEQPPGAGRRIVGVRDVADHLDPKLLAVEPRQHHLVLKRTPFGELGKRNAGELLVVCRRAKEVGRRAARSALTLGEEHLAELLVVADDAPVGDGQDAHAGVFHECGQLPVRAVEFSRTLADQQLELIAMPQQLFLCVASLGHVLERLYRADDLALRISQGRGREEEPKPRLSKVRKERFGLVRALADLRGTYVSVIQHLQVLGAGTVDDQVAEQRSRGAVEDSALVDHALHVPPIPAGQLLAGPVPVRHAMLRVDDEGRHRVAVEDLVQHLAHVQQAGLDVPDVAQVLAGRQHHRAPRDVDPARRQFDEAIIPARRAKGHLRRGRLPVPLEAVPAVRGHLLADPGLRQLVVGQRQQLVLRVAEQARKSRVAAKQASAAVQEGRQAQGMQDGATRRLGLARAVAREVAAGEFSLHDRATLRRFRPCR